jgi:hypothetical protein
VSCLDQTFSSLTVFLSWLVLFFFHPVHPVHPSPFTLCTPFTLCSPITLCSPFTLHPPSQARCGRNPLVLDHGTWRTPRTQSRPPCPWREGKATMQRSRIFHVGIVPLDKIFGQNLWTKSLDNMNIYIDNDSLFLTMIILHG